MPCVDILSFNEMQKKNTTNKMLSVKKKNTLSHKTTSVCRKMNPPRKEKKATDVRTGMLGQMQNMYAFVMS